MRLLSQNLPQFGVQKFAPIWPHSPRGRNLIPVLTAPPPQPRANRIEPEREQAQSGKIGTRQVFWGEQVLFACLHEGAVWAKSVFV